MTTILFSSCWCVDRSSSTPALLAFSSLIPLSRLILKKTSKAQVESPHIYIRQSDRPDYLSVVYPKCLLIRINQSSRAFAARNERLAARRNEGQTWASGTARCYVSKGVDSSWNTLCLSRSSYTAVAHIHLARKKKMMTIPPPNPDQKQLRIYYLSFMLIITKTVNAADRSCSQEWNKYRNCRFYSEAVCVRLWFTYGL